jgi:peptide/nickel transport system substrate-binding protein
MKKILENLAARILAITVLCAGSFALAVPDDFLIILLPQEIVTTDPMFVDDSSDEVIRGNVYEGLGEIGVDGSVTPLLASDWEASEDGAQYTFTLREGVTFHTGKTMTCQDAEYSLRSYLVFTGKPEISYAVTGYNYWDDEDGLLENTSFSLISDAIYCDEQNRLVIKLAQPTLDSLPYIADLSVVDKDVAIAQGSWSGTEEDWKDWAGAGEEPERAVLNGVSVGTGAYQLVSLETGRSIYKAFESYWGDKPAIANVVLQIVPDDNSRVLALTNGDADAIYRVSGNYRQQLEGVEGIVADETPFNFMQYLIFNQATIEGAKLGSGQLDGEGVPADFFSDVHVRRAFQYAFDDTYIIDEVFGGKAQLAQSPVYSYQTGGDFADTALSLYSLEQATEEFKLAWDGQVWEKGFNLSVGYVPEPGLEHLEFAFTILKDRIESLNPKFRLQLVRYEGGEDPYQEMYDQTVLFIDNWFRSLTAARNLEKFVNDEGYAANIKDEQLIAFSDQITAATSQEERLELFRQLREYTIENASFIVYPEHAGLYYYTTALKGVEIIPALDVGIVWRKVSK